MEFSTISTVAATILRTLEDRGIDGSAVLRECGIDHGRLQDEKGRFGYAAMTRLWHRAVALTGDECFGIRVSQHISPAGYHGLGFAWLASDSLVDAMERLVRYFRVASTAAFAQLERQDTHYTLSISPTDLEQPPAAAAMDYSIGTVIKLARTSFGENFRPLRIGLAHPAPGVECHNDLLQIFRAPIDFDTDSVSLQVDRGTAEKPLPFSNHELAHANEVVLQRYLSAIEADTVSAQVKARLVDALPAGPVSETDIAEALFISTRSLQRRLRDEGTTFKRLLDDTRSELAIHYLNTPQHSVTEVTYLLGFSDPSNFARAFRRWHGVTPSRYRNRQMDAKTAESD